MSIRKGRQVVAERTQQAGGRGSDASVENPLFGVAMLKIALELKRSTGATFEAVVTAVTARMGIDEPEFHRFLARQGGLLRTLSRSRPENA